MKGQMGWNWLMKVYYLFSVVYHLASVSISPFSICLSRVVVSYRIVSYRIVSYRIVFVCCVVDDDQCNLRLIITVQYSTVQYILSLNTSWLKISSDIVSR